MREDNEDFSVRSRSMMSKGFGVIGRNSKKKLYQDGVSPFKENSHHNASRLSQSVTKGEASH